jgi:hypothetical protein
MAQPAQVIFTDPNNDWNAIDNSAASLTTTLNNSAPIGFDTPALVGYPIGAKAQGLNSFANTGTTTLDSVNDIVNPDAQVGTFVGNPVSAVVPTYKTVTTVLNSNLSTRLLFRNPA